MTEQSSRERALYYLGSPTTEHDVARAQVYATLDVADAIREQSNLQSSYLQDLTDAVRRMENLGPMDPLIGKP